jgi:ABC-type lipoprotein release transport system permease subunit
VSFESFVALRYRAASRRRGHVALISTISILGLAVAALVICFLFSDFRIAFEPRWRTAVTPSDLP